MPEGRSRVIGFVPKEAASKENIIFEDVNSGRAKSGKSLLVLLTYNDSVVRPANVVMLNEVL